MRVHLRPDRLLNRYADAPHHRKQFGLRTEAGAAAAQVAARALKHLNMPAADAKKVCREQAAQRATDYHRTQSSHVTCSLHAPRPGNRCNQSILMPARSITSRQRLLSASTKAVASAGVLPTGSAPNSVSRFATSGNLRISEIAAESFEAIAAGVFGGATIANHSRGITK